MSVALRTWNGFYVSAINRGGDEVNARAARIDATAVFEVFDRGDDKIALQAPSGHYVRPSSDNVGRLMADRKTIGEEETFQVHFLWPGNIALSTYRSRHVCAVEGGGKQMVADREPVDEWETFEVILLDEEDQPIWSGDSPDMAAPPQVENKILRKMIQPHADNYDKEKMSGWRKRRNTEREKNVTDTKGGAQDIGRVNDKLNNLVDAGISKRVGEELKGAKKTYYWTAGILGTGVAALFGLATVSGFSYLSAREAVQHSKKEAIAEIHAATQSVETAKDKALASLDQDTLIRRIVGTLIRSTEALRAARETKHFFWQRSGFECPASTCTRLQKEFPDIQGSEIVIFGAELKLRSGSDRQMELRITEWDKDGRSDRHSSSRQRIDAKWQTVIAWLRKDLGVGKVQCEVANYDENLLDVRNAWLVVLRP